MGWVNRGGGIFFMAGDFLRRGVLVPSFGGHPPDGLGWGLLVGLQNTDMETRLA